MKGTSKYGAKLASQILSAKSLKELSSKPVTVKFNHDNSDPVWIVVNGMAVLTRVLSRRAEIVTYPTGESTVFQFFTTQCGTEFSDFDIFDTKEDLLEAYGEGTTVLPAIAYTEIPDTLTAAQVLEAKAVTDTMIL